MSVNMDMDKMRKARTLILEAVEGMSGNEQLAIFGSLLSVGCMMSKMEPKYYKEMLDLMADRYAAWFKMSEEELRGKYDEHS